MQVESESSEAFPFEIGWVTLGAAGVLLALVIGLGLAVYLAQMRRAPPRPKRPKASSSLLLEHAPDPSEGYATLCAFAPDDPDAGGRRAVMAKPAAAPAAGVRVTDAAMVYDGGRTLFRVVVMDGPMAWQAGGALYLQGEDAPVLLEDGVGGDAVRDAVKDAKEVIAIGLAAAETADPSRDATRLSFARAIHLGRALINLGLARREQVIALGLGAHRGNGGGNGAAPSRAGVLVTVLQAFRPDMEADVVQAAADVLAAQGVNLAGYAQAASPAEFWNIAPGGYGGFIASDWEQADMRSFRGV